MLANLGGSESRWLHHLVVVIAATFVAACDSNDDGEPTVINIVDQPQSELPRVVGASSTGNTTVLLSYSQPMDSGALDPNNYSIGAVNVNPESGGLIIDTVAFSGPDATAVEIVTMSQSAIEYKVSVHNVRSRNGDPIAPATNSNGVLVEPGSATFLGSAPGSGERVDTDGDGLSDDVEQLGWTITVLLGNGVDVEVHEATSDPTVSDTDDDGVSDFDERRLGMNPRDVDTDHDGLDDLLEFSVVWSSSTKQDTDGDGISDGGEYGNFRTSPLIADTDGDGFSDSAEIFDLSSEPLIADVPQAEIQLVGELDMSLNITYSDSQGTVDTYSSKLVNEVTNSESFTDNWMNQYSVEESAKITGEGGGSQKDGASGKIGGEYSVTEGYVQEITSTWTRSSSSTAREESERLRSESRNRTETASTATISAGVKVRNTSDVAFSLRNLVVTLLQIDPKERARFRTLSTLNLDDAIGDGVTLGPFNGETGVLQIANAEASASLVRDLLANPTGISLEVASFDLLDENGRNFAFLAQETNSRTALISIDFGNGRVDRFRVATDVERNPDGTAAGVRLGTAFSEILGLESGVDYETAMIDVAINDTFVSQRGLVRIEDVATPVGVVDDHRFWVVLGTDDRHATPGTDFDDILLRGGDAIFIGFVEDKDRDGLFAREEFLVGTSDDVADTDGDGLTDFEEVKEGWLVTRDDVVRVYSDPLSADSDQDGLTDIEERDSLFGATDPGDPDSDSDGLCDGPGTPFGDSDDICRRSNRDPNPLQPALTEPPQVIFLDPVENTVGADTLTNVLVSFDQPLAPGAVPILSSSMTGARPGVTTMTDNDRTLVFDPDGRFSAGDIVEVSLPSEIENVDRFALEPKVFRFTTATSPSSPNRFTAPRAFQTESNIRSFRPGSLVAADFDGDGQQDIAVGEQDDEVVVVLINDGDGGFTAESSIGVTGNPLDIDTADFDGDGRMDLTVANATTDNVGILLNIGNGRHLNFSNYNVLSDVTAVATGDFDGDMLIDIAAASSAGDGNTVVVLFNNGDRTFVGSDTLDLGTVPDAIVAADINGDGVDDLLVPSGETGDCSANSAGNGDVTVLVADGSRTLSNFTATTYPGLDVDQGWSERIVAEDFDMDGAVDMAVGVTIWDDPSSCELQSRALIVMRNTNDGTGSFEPAVRYAAAYGGGGIATADWDGDGDPDIGFDAGSRIDYLPNLGNGTFGARLSSRGGRFQGDIIATDFDNDGWSDIVTSSGADVVVHRNDGSPGQFDFNNAANFHGRFRFAGIAGADLNGDGLADFVTTGDLRNASFPVARTISALISSGDGGMEPELFQVDVVDTSANPRASLGRIMLADIDGNGATDIVATHDLEGLLFDEDSGRTDDRIEVLRNLGNGVFAPPESLPSSGLSPTDLTSGDFDGDGKLDLAVVHEGAFVSDGTAGLYTYGRDNLVVLMNENNIGFRVTQTIDGPVEPNLNPAATRSFQLVESADVDSDGAIDLIAMSLTGQVDVFLNDGSGTFARDPMRQFTAGTSDVVDMVVADIDRDYDVDIIFASDDGPFGIAAHLNDGTGNFNNGRLFMPQRAIASRLTVGDLNGDDSIDLVVASEQEKVTVLINDGAGFFDEETGYLGALGQNLGVAIGDIDGDEDLDLVVPGVGVTILVNE